MSDQYEHYPFPLTNGQIAHVMLPPPGSLTAADAERMAAFLASLTVEDEDTE